MQGKYIRTAKIRKKLSEAKKGWNGLIGHNHSERTRLKMSISGLGRKRPPFTQEWRDKLGKANKGYKKTFLAYKNILKEIPELEKQGFRCIPIGKVIPDIIAIKNGKVYAVEVEYGRHPNYSKYNDVKKYFDDIIWIIRNPILTIINKFKKDDDTKTK